MTKPDPTEHKPQQKVKSAESCDPALTTLSRLRRIVDGQAEDDGLWFVATTAPEAYLQRELRRLHHAIEELCHEQN